MTHAFQAAAGRWPLMVVVGISLGCGSDSLPQTYPVSGQVTAKGGSVAGGAVHFSSLPDSAQVATGEIKPDGSFSLHTIVGNKKLTGAVAGEYHVQVIPLPTEDQKLINVKVKQTKAMVESRDNHFVIEVELSPPNK